jgi:hypothetical protein
LLIKEGLIRAPTHTNAKHLKGKAIIAFNSSNPSTPSLSQYLKDRLTSSFSDEEKKKFFNPVAFKRNFLLFAGCFYDYFYYRTGISKYEFKFFCNGNLALIHNQKTNSSIQSLCFNLEVMDGKIRPLGTRIKVEDLSFLRLHYCNPTANLIEEDIDDDDDDERELEAVGIGESAAASAINRANPKRKLFVFSTPSRTPSPAPKSRRVSGTKH